MSAVDGKKKALAHPGKRRMDTVGSELTPKKRINVRYSIRCLRLQRKKRYAAATIEIKKKREDSRKRKKKKGKQSLENTIRRKGRGVYRSSLPKTCVCRLCSNRRGLDAGKKGGGGVTKRRQCLEEGSGQYSRSSLGKKKRRLPKEGFGSNEIGADAKKKEGRPERFTAGRKRNRRNSLIVF